MVKEILLTNILSRKRATMIPDDEGTRAKNSLAEPERIMAGERNRILLALLPKHPRSHLAPLSVARWGILANKMPLRLARDVTMAAGSSIDIVIASIVPSTELPVISLRMPETPIM